MTKQVRYVHTVNPITGDPCTIKIVILGEDVFLWQVDQRVSSEEEFDQIDMEDMSMICMPREAFREVVWAYQEICDKEAV